MLGASFKLLAHESADDLRPGRDDPGTLGRDSTQSRCALRPSVARGFAGRGGHELSAGSRGTWGLAWDRGKLGCSLREIRFRRVERPRGSRPAVAVREGRDETSGGRPEEEPCRVRIAGAALGWSAAVQLSGEAIRHRTTRPAMPAAVSSTRIPSTQTQTGNCSSGPANAGRSKKTPTTGRKKRRRTLGDG